MRKKSVSGNDSTKERGCTQTNSEDLLEKPSLFEDMVMRMKKWRVNCAMGLKNLDWTLQNYKNVI